jgi:hypothetical protein
MRERQITTNCSLSHTLFHAVFNMLIGHLFSTQYVHIGIALLLIAQYSGGRGFNNGPCTKYSLCALLGYYGALSDSSVSTCRDKLSVSS